MDCSHEACHCQSEVLTRNAAGEVFCSQYCEQAARSNAGGSCECGHAGCSIQADRPVM